MPDWIVQTPVSTVRPTPPKAPVAPGGGSGSPHTIGIYGDDLYTPTWSTQWSSGSTSRSGDTVTLAESGIWHVAWATKGSATIAGEVIVGATTYSLDGQVRGVAIGTYSSVDDVSAFHGAGGIDIEVDGSATVAFFEAGIFSTGGSSISSISGEHWMTAHWVGP